MTPRHVVAVRTSDHGSKRGVEQQQTFVDLTRGSGRGMVCFRSATTRRIGMDAIDFIAGWIGLLAGTLFVLATECFTRKGRDY